ncbi:MAG: DUF935 family protein [Cyclobacteriaceae bacterium]|nr:DUF935 family protein [Cyclobacteriaceae bacterium]
MAQYNPIINKLVVKPAVRSTTDIGQWRNAIKSADRGRRSKLYDLYEDLLIDGVLADAVDKRIDAITNAELTFQREGEVVEELEELIDTPEFERLLKEIMLSKFWGISLLEFDFTDGLKFYSIPRKHILPDKKEVIRQEYDEKGISYEGDPFILQIGDDTSLGLFLKTAPYAIYKRGGFGDWAQWIELFGMPQRIGKYSVYDNESRRLLEEAFESAGSAPSMVVPKETDVEVNNNGQGGNGVSFDDFRKACNEELLITILGQTMTTLDGSSLSQSETHKEVEEGKNKSDRRFVQRVLNHDLLPMLEARGFPVSGGTFFFPEAGESISTADRLAKDMQLNEIIDISEEYFYETYDIPRPEAGQVVAKKKQVPGAFGLPIDEAETEPPDPVNNSWHKRLFDFFVHAPARSVGAINSLIRLEDNESLNVRFEIDKLFNQALNNIYETKGKSAKLFDKHLFAIGNNPLQAGINEAFIKAGVDWGKKNLAFTAEFKANTAVFAAFKAHDQGKEIAMQLTNADGSLKSISQFKRDVKKIIDPKWRKEWLEAEYNTAVRSARMAVNWKKFEETKDLYPNLEYMPSRAANPRDEHRRFWGTILPIEHPFWAKQTPPSLWNCLCGIRATDKPVTAPPEGWESNIDPVFNNNPGQTAKFVNIDETGYAKRTDEALMSAMLQRASIEQSLITKLNVEYKRTNFKSGGYLDKPVAGSQNKVEEAKNIKIYTALAKLHGKKYKLLPVLNEKNISSPDAYSDLLRLTSEAKAPETLNGKNAIQNSVKAASRQAAPELVIYLQNEYSYVDIMNGLKASFRGDRAMSIKEVILVYADGRLKRYDVSSLRKAINKK